MSEPVSPTSTKPNRLGHALEILGVLAPILCLVDCIVVPIALAVLPFVGVTHVMHGVSDQFLTLLMVAICVPAVVPGFLKHRQARVLMLMAVGFSAIFFANIAGHAIDETLHLLLTCCGSFCLIKANLVNRKLVRQSNPETTDHCCKHA